MWLAGRQVPTTDPLPTAGGCLNLGWENIRDYSESASAQRRQGDSWHRETGMLEVCRDLNGSWPSLPSLIAALPALEYIIVYYPEGTAEFLLQQQYFLWCQCHDLYSWKTKYKWGKQGGALSEMWCKQLQRCGVLLQSHFPPGKDQSNRHCKHNRDPIWYFVKLIAYT